MEYHLGIDNYDHNKIIKALDNIGFKIISEIENSNEYINFAHCFKS